MKSTNRRTNQGRRRLGPLVPATVALVLAVVMTQLFAAEHASSSAIAQAQPATVQSTATTQKTMLDITFKSQPSPPKTGDNTFEVTVKDPAGKPITDADVAVAFRMAAMPEMKMPEMRNSVPLKHQKDGLYRGSGQVMMTGRWEVTVSVKRGGKEIGSKKLNVTAK